MGDSAGYVLGLYRATKMWQAAYIQLGEKWGRSYRELGEKWESLYYQRDRK